MNQDFFGAFDKKSERNKNRQKILMVLEMMLMILFRSNTIQ